MIEDQRKFVHPASISKHLVCSICSNVFIDPTRLYCGHTFCASCIATCIQTKQTCPICRKLIQNKHAQIDLIAKNIIDDLEVYCTNKPLCRWQGKLDNFLPHYQKCKIKDQHIPEYVRVKEDTQQNQQYLDEDLQEQLQKNDPGGSLVQRMWAKNENMRELMDRILGKNNDTNRSSEKQQKEQIEDDMDLIDNILRSEIKNDTFVQDACQQQTKIDLNHPTSPQETFKEQQFELSNSSSRKKKGIYNKIQRRASGNDDKDLKQMFRSKNSL